MSLWKVLTGRWGSGDSEIDQIRIDASTNSLQTVTYPHHERHAGNSFSIETFVDIPINDVYDVQFTTPDTTKWGHLTFSVESKGETIWFLYEDVTIVTPGSTIVPYNNNRNFADDSVMVVKGIANTDVATADDDTATAAATVLKMGTMGANKAIGNRTHEEEIVLKQNEDYCFRLIATAAGYVNFHLDWYEHTDKN